MCLIIYVFNENGKTDNNPLSLIKYSLKFFIIPNCQKKTRKVVSYLRWTVSVCLWMKIFLIITKHEYMLYVHSQIYACDYKYVVFKVDFVIYNFIFKKFSFETMKMNRKCCNTLFALFCILQLWLWSSKSKLCWVKWTCWGRA